MLYKKIKGRLGNQLFQYATIRAFQKKYFKNQKIVLNFDSVEKKAKKEKFKEINSLKNFNTHFEMSKINLTFKQRLLIIFMSTVIGINKYILKNDYNSKRNKFEEKYKDLLLKNNIICKTSGYTKFDISKMNCNKNIYFYGYFESPKYFSDIKEVLYDDFKPLNDPLKTNEKLYNLIEKTNSVCVSIRRGDFVNNDKYKKIHYVCDNNYFYESFKKMNEIIKNPQYIIFSDDIKWVKDNMKLPENSVFESGNDPVWEKLRLMYSCKHFIISNSSFSWWAQFLSKNEKKIVIAPKKWNTLGSHKDLYDESWILI